jgi:hypothetical protein
MTPGECVGALPDFSITFKRDVTFAAKNRVLAGPEVILVQCKRIKAGAEVAINEVKALWADVQDEGASKGLIATTTRLAKGARDYCDARKYRLERAEGDTVRRWIHEMASHRL